MTRTYVRWSSEKFATSKSVPIRWNKQIECNLISSGIYEFNLIEEHRVLWRHCYQITYFDTRLILSAIEMMETRAKLERFGPFLVRVSDFLLFYFGIPKAKKMTLNYGVWWVNMTPLATTSNYRRTRRIYDYIYFMWRLTNSFSLHFVYGASWFISQSICFVWWVNIQRLGIGKIAASIISSIRIYKTLMVYLFIFIATQTASEIEEKKDSVELVWKCHSETNNNLLIRNQRYWRTGMNLDEDKKNI